MPIYYYLYLTVVLIILFFITRFFFLRSTLLLTKLFILALYAENNGLYEEASVLYKDALVAVKKVSFHQILKKKIIKKLNLLIMIIKHNKSENFIRENDSWVPL